MTALAPPEAMSSVTNRISSIQSMIRSVSPDQVATTVGATSLSPAASSSSAAATSPSAGTFASALSDAMTSAGEPASAAASAAAPAANTPSQSGHVTGDDLIASAKKYLGVPYVWGGTTPSGLDCSGLVQLAFKDLGIDVPRVSRDQAKAGEAVPSLAQAEPGDLIAFGTPVNHIAIYLGNNQILEAPQPGQDVHITEIHRTPTAIRRIVPGGDGSDATGSVGAAGATGDGGQFLATRIGGASSENASAGNVLGVPASLKVKFDAAQLAAVPRAVPLAELGLIPSTSGATPIAANALSGSASAFGGYSADQLTAAGLSDAVASFAGDFAAAEKKFNLPSGVLAAVAQAESGGRTDAVSSAGAEGLMQLMPGTAAGLGVTNPFDPSQAINGAAQYLASSLSAFDGSLTKALAAYNAGPGAVRKYDGVPPYAETQNYVRKITDTLARLT